MFLLWSQKAAVAKANVNNYSAHGVWPFNHGEVKVYMSRESTHEAVAFEDSVVVVVSFMMLIVSDKQSRCCYSLTLRPYVGRSTSNQRITVEFWV